MFVTLVVSLFMVCSVLRMIETTQNFVKCNEQQNCDMQESDQPHLDVNKFNQQHTAEVAPREYSYAVNESENQGLDGNGQVF